MRSKAISPSPLRLLRAPRSLSLCGVKAREDGRRVGERTRKSQAEEVAS